MPIAAGLEKALPPGNSAARGGPTKKARTDEGPGFFLIK
jgi:hypothetical protein